MHRPFLLGHLIPAVALLLASAGSAGAATVLRTLPFDLHEFATSGPGPVDPAVLVGFNPQPDPPGDFVPVDLSNPFDPSITQPGSGMFTILFGIHGPGGDPYSFILPRGGPSTDGIFSFLAEAGDGSVFRASFDISGFAGGWVGFNPQPDPPGDYASSFVGFSFAGDPTLSWSLEAGTLNGDAFIPDGFMRFSAVPEPAGLGVIGIGLAAIATLRRRRQA